MASSVNLIFMISLVLPTLIVSQEKNEKFNWKRCPRATSGQTLMCYRCDSQEGCETPRKVNCDATQVKATAESIAKVFYKGLVIEENNKETSRYLCLSFEARRADGKQFIVRGCTFDSEDVNLIRSEFDYNLFYGQKQLIRTRSGTILFPGIFTYSYLVPNHNKTYWDETHWDIASCFQCADKWCNKFISPFETGKVLFQRRYRNELLWDCIDYVSINGNSFRQKCQNEDMWTTTSCIGKYRDHDYRPNGRKYKLGDWSFG